MLHWLAALRRHSFPPAGTRRRRRLPPFTQGSQRALKQSAVSGAGLGNAREKLQAAAQGAPGFLALQHFLGASCLDRHHGGLTCVLTMRKRARRAVGEWGIRQRGSECRSGACSFPRG